MTPPTIVTALIGGALIGTSASIMLLLSGRVAGISGIVGGLLRPEKKDSAIAWRVAFILGLLVGGLALSVMRPSSFLPASSLPLGVVALAGLFVGVGTALGNGCTSGHGVCGISRFSTRSIVATVVFMATAMIVTFASHHLLGIGSGEGGGTP